MKHEQPEISKVLLGVQFDLYAFISALMSGSEDAADVLQEVNLTILKHADQYDPMRPFILWARGVARNSIKQYYRKRSRDRLVFDDELITSLAEQMPCADDSAPLEDLTLLERCLGRLAQKQRDIINARYMRGMSVKDIAAAEERSEGSVSVFLHRVRQILADCVEKERKKLGECV